MNNEILSLKILRSYNLSTVKQSSQTSIGLTLRLTVTKPNVASQRQPYINK